VVGVNGVWSSVATDRGVIVCPRTLRGARLGAGDPARREPRLVGCNDGAFFASQIARGFVPDPAGTGVLLPA
jgi:hypothetical protein